MPFDALNQSVENQSVDIDELEAIGITPVPMDVLQRHKNYMMATHIGHSRTWLTAALDMDGLTLAKQLARIDYLPEAKRVYLTRFSGAPWRVQRLAEKVHTALPDAIFTVGLFYKDPYLMVHYGHSKRACLAIWWNRFRLVEIAKQT